MDLKLRQMTMTSVLCETTEPLIAGPIERLEDWSQVSRNPAMGRSTGRSTVCPGFYPRQQHTMRKPEKIKGRYALGVAREWLQAERDDEQTLRSWLTASHPDVNQKLVYIFVGLVEKKKKPSSAQIPDGG